MNGSLDERLRRAMGQQAQSTTTAPDGWRRVQARLDGDAPLRRSGRRWFILVPVATLALVALVVPTILTAGGGERSVHVAGGAGRLYLAPTGVQGRFHLTGADTDPQVLVQPATTFRAFGRRAPDGLALEASVVITVPADFALTGADAEGPPLPVLGRDDTVSTDHYGLKILSWAQAGGQTVGVMTYGLAEGDLTALAKSLVAGDAATEAPVLPPGIAPVHSGRLPAGALPVTIQSWEADDGDGFMVTVADVPDVTADDVAWYLPGGRAAKVRGRVGVYSERQDRDLMWIERPGVVVTVHAIGLSGKDVQAVANGLQPVSEQAWQDLTASAPRPGAAAAGPVVVVPASPKLLTADNSYFPIRPIEGRLTPPCDAGPIDPAAQVLAETRDGRVVGCVRLGPAMVAADDVATATARQGRTALEWEVEFTLSKEGAARFGGWTRAVGTGGEIAILVDGRVVSTPRLASPSVSVTGAVTGLDEQTARRLAARLRP